MAYLSPTSELFLPTMHHGTCAVASVLLTRKRRIGMIPPGTLHSGPLQSEVRVSSRQNIMHLTHVSSLRLPGCQQSVVKGENTRHLILMAADKYPSSTTHNKYTLGRGLRVNEPHLRQQYSYNVHVDDMVIRARKDTNFDDFELKGARVQCAWRNHPYSDHPSMRLIITADKHFLLSQKTMYDRASINVSYPMLDTVPRVYSL